jgi:acetyl-CoA acetyltransferase
MAFSDLRDKIAVVGIGTTAFGNFPEYDDIDQGVKAATLAIQDCGIDKDKIDGLIVHRLTSFVRMGEVLGLNPRHVGMFVRSGRFCGIAIQNAVAALLSGQADYVLTVYANNGRSVRDTYGGGEGGLWNFAGMTSPGAQHAMMFERYAHQYNVDREKLATIPLTFRQHAQLNETAVMKKPLSLDEYMTSRFIAEPLRLFDYCLINDGAVALVLTTAERAKDLKQKPVYISGFGTASELVTQSSMPQNFWKEPMREIAKDIYGMAGIERKDLSGLMIYDNFSPTVLFSLEGFGFCNDGEALDWIQDGRIALGGEFPTNTSGGHLSESYMQGWALNAEAIRQLRGDCGERQIENAQHIQYMCAAPVCSSIIYRS